MIVHCSRKLADKLPEVSSTPLAEDSPLGSWHGHLFTVDRRHCILFCHDRTRYSLFMAGLRKPQFAELGKWFRLLFTASLAVAGCPDSQIRKIEMLLGPVRHDTATDRSVLGTINIARKDLDALVWRVPNVLELDPLEVAAYLNGRPVTVRSKFLWPVKEMQAWVGEIAKQ